MPPPAPAAPQPAAPPAVGAPPAPRVDPAQPRPAAGRRFVVFNFDNADIELVVQAASEIVGFNYIIAPAARGRKVTIQTPARIPADEVFAVLTTVLDVNGLAAVKSGNLYRIIPREGAPQTSVRTVVGREMSESIPTDEVVTQVVPLQYVNAADMAALVRPFVPPTGTVSAQRETNLLIITDAASNVRRLLEMIRLTDVQVALDEIKIIPLKFADAQEVAQLLGQLFAGGRLRPTAQAGAGPAPPPGPTGVAPVARTAITGGDGAAADRPPLIVPERRSNSLVVHARKAEMETIRRLIEQLDLDIYGGQRVFIYFLENTKAKELASTLDQIYGTGAGSAVSATPSTGPGTVQQPGRAGAQTSLAPSAPTTQPRTTRPSGGGLLGAGEEGAPPAIEVRFIADEATNSIIVTTYPRAWKDIEETIKKLDRMPRQVLIEVLAAEVTLDDQFNLGMAWAFSRGRTVASFSPIPVPPGLQFPATTPPVTTLLPQGLSAAIFASDEFIAALNALASDNRVNVVSSPAVMTSENKKAVINVSQSVPIVTSQYVPLSGTGDAQAASGTQSVEYRDAGIILTVTPRIGEGGTVALEVKQEFNEVGPTLDPPGSPTFLKREAETSVVLLNNQTLVLGGLIQTRREVGKTGIPLLMKIPVLGYLFGATKETTKKTELLILITPRVVGTPADANRVTEEFRRSIPALEEPIRQAPRAPALPK
jgi:general secretion pathway protein D